MPQLDMFSWLNQVLTTTVVMFFFYALLTLVFLQSVIRRPLIFYYKLSFFLMVLVVFFLSLDDFNVVYNSLAFQPSMVLLSGKGSSSGMSPKATVKKSKTGQQDAANDGSAYDVDDDQAWPAEEIDLYDLLPSSGGANSTVSSALIKKQSAPKTENYDFQAHEFATGPTETTSGYYGPGIVNRILELCGYTHTETQKVLCDAKIDALNSQCKETVDLAYLAGVKAGEAAALAKMTVFYAVCNSIACIIFAKLLLLLLFTLFFDYILSEIEYNYFHKNKKWK
jgi:hypothetical protein